MITMTEEQRKWCENEKSPTHPGDSVEIWESGRFKGRGVAIVVAGDMVAVGFADGHIFCYPRIQVTSDESLLWAGKPMTPAPAFEPRPSDCNQHKEKEKV